MKRVRPKADDTIAEEATADAARQPDRKSGLLRECWADLRGRPRPVAEMAWKEEPESRIETGGIGIDEDGFRRMEAGYSKSSMAERS